MVIPSSLFVLSETRTLIVYKLILQVGIITSLCMYFFLLLVYEKENCSLVKKFYFFLLSGPDVRTHFDCENM